MCFRPGGAVSCPDCGRLGRDGTGRSSEEGQEELLASPSSTVFLAGAQGEPEQKSPLSVLEKALFCASQMEHEMQLVWSES